MATPLERRAAKHEQAKVGEEKETIYQTEDNL